LRTVKGVKAGMNVNITFRRHWIVSRVTARWSRDKRAVFRIHFATGVVTNGIDGNRTTLWQVNTFYGHEAIVCAREHRADGEFHKAFCGLDFDGL
jgi:hypothetical protein